VTRGSRVGDHDDRYDHGSFEQTDVYANSIGKSIVFRILMFGGLYLDRDPFRCGKLNVI